MLTRLAQEFNLTEIEKVIVQAYIAISPKEREKFVRAIEEVVNQTEITQQASEPEIEQTTNQKQKEDDEYIIIQTTTVGKEMDRLEAEQARRIADAKAKKNAV